MKNYKKKFLLIQIGQCISLLTGSILNISISWHLTESTGSALYLSLAVIFGYFPEALLSPIAGVIVDRYNKKSVIILADAFIALLSLTLGIIIFSSNFTILAIFITLFFRSIGGAFHRSAFIALTPSLVPKNELAKFAGYTQSFSSISYLLSPIFGAILYSTYGFGFTVLLDVIGAIFAITILLVIKIPQCEKIIKKTSIGINSIKHELIDGIRVMRETKGITTFIVIGSLYSFFYSPIGALFPFITINYFGGTSQESAVVEVSFFFGMLLGGMLLGKIIENIKSISLMCFSVFIYGLSITIIGLLPTDGYIVFVAFSFIMGLVAPLFFGIQTSVLQLKIPNDYLGRIGSINLGARTLIMPISLSISGVFVEIIGIENWYLISGISIILLAIVAFLNRELKHCN